MEADEYLTRDQAAALLGVGLRQLYQYADDGLVTKYVNASGHVRFRRAEILAFKRRRASFVPARKAG